MTVHVATPWRPKEFTSVEAMLEHYKTVRARLRGSNTTPVRVVRPKAEEPAPVAAPEPTVDPVPTQRDYLFVSSPEKPAPVAAPAPAEPALRDYLFVSGPEQHAELRAEIDALRWKSIVAEVCEKHNLTWSMLMSDRRHVGIVRARHEAFWRMSRECRMSLPAIGRRMGRDHTTVLHGVRTFQKLLDSGEVTL